jgi:hypothetical protein
MEGHMPPRLLSPVCYASSVLLLASASSACFGPQREWPDGLVWSPDGKHAAVLTGGFHLSDVNGNLSPQLDDRVYRVAWLDSEHLVLARARTVSTFAEVAQAVGPRRTEAIVAEIEHAWTHIQSPEFPETGLSVSEKVALLYLRDHYAEAIRERFSSDWSSVETATAELHQLVLGRLVDDRLQYGTLLSEDIVPIKYVRPAPDGRAVAFVTRDEEFMSGDGARIHVAAIEGAVRPRLVAESTGDSVDWSADGRSLLYFAESGWDPNVGRYGCLAQRMVVDAAGEIGEPDERFAKCLSRVVFERSNRMSALPDGRVLFQSRKITLPSDSVDEMQLFVLKREPDRRYPRLEVFPVTPLISLEMLEDEGGLAFFDVSPDRRAVLYATSSGNIRVLTLATGRTELIPLERQSDSGGRCDFPQAVWSGPDAFTYLKKMGARNEFILRRGSSETVLSRNWPKELLWLDRPE